MDAQLALPLSAAPDGFRQHLESPARHPARAAGLAGAAARSSAVASPAASAHAHASATGLRLGEVLVALSHALDLASGEPLGHAVRSCWIGQQIGRAIGLNAPEMRELYCTALLKDAGCSSNAARLSQLFLTDDLCFKHDYRAIGIGAPSLAKFVIGHTGTRAGIGQRVRALLNVARNGPEIARGLIETRSARGAQVARQLRLPGEVANAIQSLDEHWDGSGLPQGLAGATIPLPARVAALAQVVDVFHTRFGPQATREEVARRAGNRLDPRLAYAFGVLARDREFWRQLAADDLETRLLALEPVPSPEPIDDDHLDDIAETFGQVVDAKSPFTAGHSARVADTADQLAQALGLASDARRWLRRGALLHDIGKLGMSNTLLDKPGRLDAWEWAAMQRHAFHTESILGRIASFGALARVAGAHHEKLDGTGYPRGLDSRHIRLETRLITTADIFDALTADRPQRPALPAEQALALMQQGVGSTIDGDCLNALRRAVIARAD